MTTLLLLLRGIYLKVWAIPKKRLENRLLRWQLKRIQKEHERLTQ